jgi:signal transduction histidine kinase
MDGLFSLSIHDDGIGFDDGRAKGRGINNMKTRASDIGGRLSVSSGNGTRVCLEIPV